MTRKQSPDVLLMYQALVNAFYIPGYRMEYLTKYNPILEKCVSRYIDSEEKTIRQWIENNTGFIDELFIEMDGFSPRVKHEEDRDEDYD